MPYKVLLNEVLTLIYHRQPPSFKLIQVLK
jgi:hypothetical protein